MEQFKVGDWVKTKAGFIKQISCLTGDKCDTLSIGNTSVGINVVFKNEIELWQPKEGEWCWFWNSALGIWFISTLKDFGECNNSIQYRCNSVYYMCEKCEPFFGELPSSLKDKQ